MGTRRLLAVVMSTVGLVTAVGVGSSATSGAATYQDNPYKTAGTVVSAGANLGENGSFVLGGLYRGSGASIEDAKDADGNVTIYTTPNTQFLRQQANGRYRTSDDPYADVVVPGQDVLVAGRWYVVDNRKSLFASYVWNPPPDALTTRPPNPQPKLPRDGVVQRLFGAIGIVTENGTTLFGQTGWSQSWGFTMGDITFHGNDHVRAIALHHDNKLRIYYSPTTRYWRANGTSTLDRNEVVGPNVVLRVTGRYSWDGFDWRFVATNVFADPNPSQGGPLDTTAQLSRDGMGVFETATDWWQGTTWSGRTTNFDGPSQATMTMTLDWVYDAARGSWDFNGQYQIQKDGSANSLQGGISGSVIVQDGVSTTEAVLSVTTATGAWNGWSGDGTFEGTAQFLSAEGSTRPPTLMGGAFHWDLLRPTA